MRNRACDITALILLSSLAKVQDVTAAVRRTSDPDSLLVDLLLHLRISDGVLPIRQLLSRDDLLAKPAEPSITGTEAVIFKYEDSQLQLRYELLGKGVETHTYCRAPSMRHR